jgi:hypothetical protein
MIRSVTTSPLRRFAEIDPKNTVDKLNKSKLTGNVNVNKMVLRLVSCWWWSYCFCLAENATTNHRQALQWRAAAGDESTIA